MSSPLYALSKLRGLDAFVLLFTTLLILAGLWFLDSAGHGSDVFVTTQLRWLVLSLAVALPAMFIPWNRLLSLAPALYAFGLLLLIFVKLAGPVINGSQRWLPLLGRGLQPSEFMKVFTLLLLARIMRPQCSLDKYGSWFPLIIAGLLPTTLIIIQPDLGTSLLFVPLTVAVLIVGGAPWKKLLLAGVLGAAALAACAGLLLEDYQKERIWSTLHIDNMTAAQRSGPGYQLEQSLIAVGNGGLGGHDHGEGPRVQSGRLPYHQNDFIFALIAEEQGFVGTTLFVLLEVLFVLAIFRVGAAQREAPARVLCAGAAVLLGTQAFVHMAVTVALAPTKGLPLPLVSAGGSSLMVSILLVALVQNVAMHRGRWHSLGALSSSS